MLISDAFERIRILLNDESSTRWSDSVLLLWFNDGLIELRDIRTDILLDSEGNRISYTRIKTINDSLTIEDEWFEALINYTCWRALSEGSEDSISQQRSEIFFQEFKNNIT